MLCDCCCLCHENAFSRRIDANHTDDAIDNPASMNAQLDAIYANAKRTAANQLWIPMLAFRPADPFNPNTGLAEHEPGFCSSRQTRQLYSRFMIASGLILALP